MPTKRYNLDELVGTIERRPAPETNGAKITRTPADPDSGRAGDAYAAEVDPGDILAEHGWTYSHDDSDGNRYYSRPGKTPEEGISTTVFADGLVFNHSTTATAMTGIPYQKSVDAFGLVAHLDHRGDFTAARRALNDAGYGDAVEELPPWETWVEQARRKAGLDPEALPVPGWSSTGDGEEPGSIADAIFSSFLYGDQILDVPPKAPLVDGWLDVGDFAVLYGAPGGGKSFVSIDMAACVALGRPWHGHDTEQGAVLYIVAEGAQGVPQRWRAWKAANGHTGGIPFVWRTSRIALRDRAWSRGLAEAALRLDPVPKLIVIDTLARTFDGGNENSSEDMGAYIAGCDDLREATGATILVIHHSGKDAGAGGRGHSSLLGAVDAELALKKTANRRFTLESTKQKDKEQESATSFKLVPAGPRDEHGRQSVAVELDESPEAGSRVEHMKLIEVLEALRSVSGWEGTPTGAWLEACQDAGISQRTSFFTAKKELEDRGAVTNIGSASRPRWRPSSSSITDPDSLLEDVGNDKDLVD